MGGFRGVPPAYVLGGYESAVAVIRALGAAEITVVAVWDSDAEMAHRSRYVKAGYRGPNPWHEPEEYVDFLLSLERRHGGGLLVPTTDETVSTVGRAKDELEGHHVVACPPCAVVERFLDKRVTYELADRLGIALPTTLVPSSVNELQQLAPQVPYPCVVKPRLSHLYRETFGVKMTRADDPEQLMSAWQRAERAGIDVVVQEFIPGPESGGVNYNAYLVDGEPLVAVTARKVRLSPPDLGFPTVVVSRHVPEVHTPARRLLQAMRLSGFANVEFKRDARNGVYKLMEVNGRPNMSGLLSVRCGVDFPLITYRHLVLGQRPLAAPDQPYEQGVYWINEAADLLAAPSLLRTNRSSLRGFLEPYLRPHVFASLALTDPAPLVARTLGKLAPWAAGLVPMGRGGFEPPTDGL